MLSVLEGDSPGSPFFGVFFCPFPSQSTGRLQMLWRRDYDSDSSYFREHPLRNLTHGLPVVYLNHWFYEALAP